MQINNLFFERLKKIYSETDYKNIISGFSQEKKTTFRINTLKSNEEEIENFLNSLNISFEKIDIGNGISNSLTNKQIVYITDKKNEYSIKGSDIFYKGKIYLQGISSMLPVIMLDPKKGEKILDMTAAPGSKTTQIAMYIKNDGEIVAVEQNQIRFDKLNYNIKLQNVSCIKTIKTDSKKLISQYNGEYFDKILLDAPCSAEGRINFQNEKTYAFWSEENILKKNIIQKELIESAIPLLKKGGEIIYSTCTIAPEENELIINDLINKFNNMIVSPIPFSDYEFIRKGINKFNNYSFDSTLTNTFRILPTSITEGFFIAKMQKII